MATAGPSTRPSTQPNPAPSHEDDLAIALALQLEELEIETQSRKGKQRAGKISDRHVALQDYKNLLVSMSQLHVDQRMAQSIADAVHQDSSLIAEHVAMENTAARDREQALQMAHATPRTAMVPPVSPSPRPRSAASTYSDDARSVFTGYEQQATFPGYILDDEYEYEENTGSTSRRPQEKAIQYYTGPKRECSICFNVVPESQSAICPCNHTYCTECLRSYALRAMKDESLYPLKCCKIEVPEDTVAKILTEAEYERYQETAIEYSTINRIYCPNKQCLRFIPPNFTNEQANYGVCATAKPNFATFVESNGKGANATSSKNNGYMTMPQPG
ncbi:hypothetical protein TWF281_008587 [Arthrobotrys megalospora]